jgi:hypothetical protein
MISAKEKAKELVEKFKLNVLDYEGNGINEYKAKQCVLIAIQFAKENPLNTDGYNKYLQEVKQEILKL